MRVRALLGFTCLLAAASLLGACSASDTLDKLSKAQYLAQLREVVAQVKQEAKLPEQLLQAEDSAKRKRLLNQAVAHFDATVKRLDAIEPPSDVAELHDQLVNVMNGFAGLFTRANASLQAGDFAALLGLQTEAAELGGEFGTLRQDFAAQGYETGGKAPGGGAEAGSPGIGAPGQ